MESGSSATLDADAADASNLFRVIDKDNVHGLNLAVPESAQAVIKPWHERADTAVFADSGVDDQMIIHVPFTESVRLRSVLLKLGAGESTPRTLRIFANHATIVDFADAERTRPQLDIRLLEGEVDVVEYPLRVAAFASVTSLSLFFGDAVGEETSRVYYLGFRGDLRNPRKDANSKLDIPAANAADAPLVDRVSEKTAGAQTTAR
ncbi:galactose-binding domain-like protein [Schizophyllum fasciatum]